MRTWLPTLMVLTVVGQDARSVEACEDKFLLVGRGVRGLLGGGRARRLPSHVW